MKRLVFLFASMAIVLSAASCTKEDQIGQVPSEKKLPAVEITVGGMTGAVDDGVATKAVKTDWEAGDKINIWFDAAAHKYGSFSSGDEHFYPELVLTFNGSSWEPEFSSFFEAEKLVTGKLGKIRAIYESTNDIRRTFNCTTAPGEEEIYDRYTTATASTNYHMTPMIVDSYADYTYDSVENKISASISAWEFLTKVQVLVTGLKQDRSYYTLSALTETDSETGAVVSDGDFYRLVGFQFSTDRTMGPYNFDTSSFGAGAGTVTAEGASFFFYDVVTPGEPRTYKLQLRYLASPPKGWTTYTATFENKTISTSPDRITCIKIDKSKFSTSAMLK